MSKVVAEQFERPDGSPLEAPPTGAVGTYVFAGMKPDQPANPWIYDYGDTIAGEFLYPAHANGWIPPDRDSLPVGTIWECLGHANNDSMNNNDERVTLWRRIA